MHITVYSSFETLPTQARQCWRYPAQPNFFLSLDWFAVLAQTSLPPSTELRLYLATDNAHVPLALLACCTEPGSRQLRSLTNFYTTEFAPVALGAASDPAPAVAALVAHIAAERPAWHSVDLRLMRAQEAPFTALQNALRRHGFAVHPYFQYENWFTATPDTRFDAYFAARPSQLRNTVSRRERKLKREHEVALTLVREPGAALETALAQFITVYQGSWKQPEPYPDFMGALARAAARCGVLRLGVLTVDGQPAAAQLWINTPGRAMIYKLAYDEKFRDYSVGSVLSSALFTMALDEDRVVEIDYGVGSEPYKRDWMTAVRTIEGLMAYNTRTLRGLMHAVAQAAVANGKKWRHRWLKQGLNKSSHHRSHEEHAQHSD